MNHAPLASLLAATTTKTTTKSSSPASLIIFLLLIVLVGYFLVIRPRRQRVAKVASTRQTIDVGTEVMSVGGIMGRVVGIGSDHFEVAVAPDLVVTFIKRAINPHESTGTWLHDEEDGDPIDPVHDDTVDPADASASPDSLPAGPPTIAPGAVPPAASAPGEVEDRTVDPTAKGDGDPRTGES